MEHNGCASLHEWWPKNVKEVERGWSNTPLETVDAPARQLQFLVVIVRPAAATLQAVAPPPRPPDEPQPPPQLQAQ